jgi:hypothetical protein
MVTVLQRYSDISEIVEVLKGSFSTMFSDPKEAEATFQSAMVVLEAMVADGWVKCAYDPSRPLWTPSEWSDRPIQWATAEA